MTATIRVGTSGYSFPDWVGTVYPPGTRPADFLRRYAEWFDVVEINTTYYRTPSPHVFEGMLAKVPKDFTFLVKLPAAMTHERGPFDAAVGPFLDAVAPLSDAKQLGGLLAQFPTSFTPSAESLRRLERLARIFGEVSTLHVEFRHDAWPTEETLARLREWRLGFVNVDLPALPRLPSPSEILTTPVAYVRLHGRNREAWWNPSTASHRYDYLYSDAELDDWVGRIRRMADAADIGYVFANNCHLGQSVVNALQLRERLELGAVEPAPGSAPSLFERSLDERIDGMRCAIERARSGVPTKKAP